jgi:hypothetical protein
MQLRGLVAFLLLALSSCAAEVVDRMVAVVNKQVILQSELEQTAHVEFLLQGKPPSAKPATTEMQAVLDQLIDRDLLEQQIMNPAVLSPTKEEVAARIKEVRTQIPGADTNDGWKAVLAAYGVSEQDVEEQIISQLRILKFVDLRFRALAQVDRTAVSSYYQEKLLPQLHQQGAPVPPLKDVAAKIEKILAEQRIDELLNSWLQTLRSQSHIQKIALESGMAGAGAPAYATPSGARL